MTRCVICISNSCKITKKSIEVFCSTPYSAVPNKRTVWNNRAGYYIGLFGHYIKNHVLFNNFF